MTSTEAHRRYFRVLIPAMIVLVCASAAIAWFRKTGPESSMIVYAAAIVPIGALLVAFWAQWRFMNEIDEFLRSIHMQAVLFGLALLLVISTGWGYLEFYADVPRLDVFWLNPIFWIGYALAQVVLNVRATGRIE